MKHGEQPIELARNPSWRKRMADVRRAHAIAEGLQRERRRGRRDALAFAGVVVLTAGATAFALWRC